jgi:prepilin-type N-terminal cleavage/methylation domain-containing protein
MPPDAHFGSIEKGGGFTLVELLAVLSIIGVLTAATIPAITSLGGNANMAQNSDAVATILQQAQSRAMARGTYVWVGFLADTRGGVGGLDIGAVESRTGQASDLTVASGSNLQESMNCRFMPNIGLMSNPSIGGMASGGVDITAANQPAGAGSTPAFQISVSGFNRQFTQILQFSPNGECSIPSGTFSPWINIGIKPLNGKGANIAAVQVSGMSGEVESFLP